MKRLFLICHLIAAMHLIYAQNPEFNIESVDNTLNTIQSSPTAASLGQYGSYPVSGSSGLPSVSIPLLEIKGTEMSVPVSLSYHGDGVMVDEVASWVGMGWSLNAGGVITRSIAGLPDEDGDGLYGLYNLPSFTPDNPANGYGLGWDFMYELSSGFRKGEPDIYSYNFLGYSGQFFIDNNENVYHYNNTDLKFSRIVNIGDIIQFKVIIGDGTQLIFSTLESVLLMTGDQGSYEGETAWYLTSLSKGNDHFTFLYEEETINDGYSCSEIGTYAITNGAGACLNTIDREIVQGPTSTKTKQRLKYIIGPFGTAEFHEHGVDRIDQSGTKKLDSITYLDQTILIKSNYTQGTYKTSINCTNIGGAGVGIQERLFLDEVELVAGSDSKKYSLEYTDPNALPPTKSFDQDHWGYYNDANNSTLLPAVSGFTVGGDREPNITAMKFGSLEKITYPTGGYAEFTWEPNRTCTTSNQQVEVCSTLLNFTLYDSDTDPFNSGEIREYPFTLSQTSDVNFSIDVGYFAQNSSEPGTVSVSIEKTNGTVHYSGQHEFDDNQTITLNLTSGSYKAVLENLSPVLDEVSFHLEECHDEMQSVTTCQYYGGLRIKSLENFTDNNLGFNKVDYEYGDLTSSRIMTTGGYTKQIKRICGVGGGASAEFVALKRHDKSLIQYSNGVTYKTITENFNTNGRIEYEYYDLNDNWGGNSYEAVLLQDHSWKRNILKRKSIFDGAGLPVSETTNHYTFVSNHLFKGLKVDLITWNDLNGGNGDHEYASGTVNLYSDWARLDSTTDVSYYTTGSLLKRTLFDYYHPDELVKPNLVKTTTSNGDSLTAITLYPNSFSNVGTLWENLKDKYYYNPIEKIIIKNDQVTQSSVYEYDSNGDLISNKILNKELTIPIANFDFANQSSPELKGYFLPSIDYDSESEISLTYDDERVVNKITKQGINVSYIWGYSGKYPVAEVSNYSRVQLVSLIGQAKLDDIKNSISDTYIETEMRALQAMLPSYTQLTFYTYEPGVGVSSVTDPNGRTSTYEYDSFGRLSKVLDHEGNVLKRIDYNYKNN